MGLFALVDSIIYPIRLNSARVLLNSNQKCMTYIPTAGNLIFNGKKACDEPMAFKIGIILVELHTQGNIVWSEPI